MTARIVVANAKGGSNRRRAAFGDWLRDTRAAVALLSEAHRMRPHLHGHLTAAGDATLGQREVAALTTTKPQADDRGRLSPWLHLDPSRPAMWTDRWWLMVQTRLDGTPTRCYSLHLHPLTQAKDGSPRRVAQWRATRTGLKALEARLREDIDDGWAVVVGGDLNWSASRRLASLDPMSPGRVLKRLGLAVLTRELMWLAWTPASHSCTAWRIARPPGSDHIALVADLTARKPAPKPKPTPKPKPKPQEDVMDWMDKLDLGRDPSGRPLVLDRRTKAKLDAACARLGIDLTVVQGSYRGGAGAAASAGTHDGGGVVDLRTWDIPANIGVNRVVRTLRECGLIAWHRTKAQGFDPHIHAIDLGNPALAPSAARQVESWRAGRNGLASNGPDDGPRVAIPKEPPPMPKPKTPAPNHVQQGRADVHRAVRNLTAALDHFSRARIGGKTRPHVVVMATALRTARTAIKAALAAGPTR